MKSTVEFECEECRSSVEVLPSHEANWIKCQVCGHEKEVAFSEKLTRGELDCCPGCKGHLFYKQKDFSRKWGVSLFILGAITSIYTYGLSFVALYIVDFIFFQKLKNVAQCYNCRAIFRNLKNIDQIKEFDHELHDRLVYGEV